MNQLEQALFQAELGDVTPRMTICSETQIDAGRWWRRTPLWLCLVDSEIVTFAIARRRYIQRVPISDCSESHYCHATGELVIAPTEELAFNRFAMSPKQALDFLRAVGIYHPTTVEKQPPTKEISPEPKAAPEPKKAATVDEVTALLESEELKALLSDDERKELAHLSPDEIRSLLDEVNNAEGLVDGEPEVDDIVNSDAEADEVAALLDSDELKALLSDEEREELKNLSIDEIRAMLDSVDDDDDDDEDEEGANR